MAAQSLGAQLAYAQFMVGSSGGRRLSLAQLWWCRLKMELPLIWAVLLIKPSRWQMRCLRSPSLAWARSMQFCFTSTIGPMVGWGRMVAIRRRTGIRDSPDASCFLLPTGKLPWLDVVGAYRMRGNGRSPREAHFCPMQKATRWNHCRVRPQGHMIHNYIYRAVCKDSHRVQG